MKKCMSIILLGGIFGTIFSSQLPGDELRKAEQGDRQVADYNQAWLKDFEERIRLQQGRCKAIKDKALVLQEEITVCGNELENFLSDERVKRILKK